MNTQDMRRRKVRIAWVLFAGSSIGWPISAAWVWWRMDGFSPFEQLMLFWSCLAVVVESGNFITSSQVHEEQGEQGDSTAAGG